MNKETPYLLVLSTCPDQATAERIAQLLVEEKLAACVNVIPDITSLFQWQGKLDRENEILLLIKTTAASYSALETLVRQQHPYELPEIIAVPIVDGLNDYLDWVSSNTKST